MSEKTDIVLIVDDNPNNLLLLEKMLSREGYSVLKAHNGIEAIEVLEHNRPHLILLDVMMPELDGYETCKILKEADKTRLIPVIFLTAKTEQEDITKGFEVGAVDYVIKPFRYKELLSRVKTHIEITKLRSDLESKVEERTADLQKALEKLETSHVEILNRLGRAAEFRDNETAMHLYRMSHYSAVIAQTMGLSEAEVAMIKDASIMHDVGKIGIPDNILLKPGKLTPEEFEIMKNHTLLGGELLKGIDSDLLRMAETIALTHHEKWDGSGYPIGLKAEDIPLVGRIVAVADVFDALTTERPYKKAWSNEESLQFLQEQKGRHFDPVVVDAFLQKTEEILKIKEKFKDKNGI